MRSKLGDRIFVAHQVGRVSRCLGKKKLFLFVLHQSLDDIEHGLLDDIAHL